MPFSAKINYAAAIFNLLLLGATGGTNVVCIIMAGISFCFGTYFWAKAQ